MRLSADCMPVNRFFILTLQGQAQASIVKDFIFLSFIQIEKLEISF
jgi:hypothetical protein